jgi:hypothetical protein
MNAFHLRFSYTSWGKRLIDAATTMRILVIEDEEKVSAFINEV